MMRKKCCEKPMELKAVGTRLSDWDLFFQCQECGKTRMERVAEYINEGFQRKLNKELKKQPEEK